MVRVCKIISFLLLLSVVGSALAAPGRALSPAETSTTPAVAAPPAVPPTVSVPVDKNAKPLLVLSFVEWKTLRVHEAQQRLERVAKSGDGLTSSAPNEDKNSDQQKLNFNVDVALQLNVQDYFSMYLKNLSKEEFKEATKKLNHEEVSELLLAYKASQEALKAPSLKLSKTEKR